MLTKEDLKVLQRPFAPNEHEFLKGNAYITEFAITNRIEMVDPAWSLEQVSLYHRPDTATNRPIVICTMRLTICGVSRDGVGMADVSMMKDNKGEANEAEKSAATDAMKRAARLFGIGRYLLNLPDNVRDAASMTRYLGGQAQTPARPVTPPLAPQNAANGQPSSNPVWFDVAVGEAWTDLKAYLLEAKIYTNDHEMKNSMIKRGVIVDNKIAETWKHKLASELVAFLKSRHEEKQTA
jgi:hypothetical protein